MICESTVKRYCKGDITKIENYDLAMNDTTKTWDCHHRRETIYTKAELIEIGEYENRPAEELIFLTKSEHDKLHYTVCKGAKERNAAISEATKGVPKSEAAKKAMSEARKGIPLSEEHCKAISDGKKDIPLSEEHKIALSEAQNRPEVKAKQSESHKGQNAWTNGIVEKHSRECPGPDFVNMSLRKWRKTHG